MRSQYILLFIVLYITPLSGVGTDLYSPSLPAIAIALSAPSSLVKLTLATYLYGFSAGQLIFGTWSDSRGRKLILIISLTLFCIASFAATMANNIYALLFIRAIQGFCAAGPSVISKAILIDSMDGKALKKASIYLITVWGLSPIIAPAIGGYLQHFFSWVANFYFLTGYSFTMWLLAVLLLKETHHNRHDLKLAAIVTKYTTLLKHRTFIANLACMGLGFSSIMVFNVFGPFLVQQALGYSAITYGHLAMIIGIGFFIGTLSNRWLMLHFDTRFVNRIGVIIALVTVTISTILAYCIKMNLLTLLIPTFVIILTTGLLQTNFMTHSLSLFRQMGGAASAAIGILVSFTAGLATAASSLLSHNTNNQIAFSWFYLVMIMIYAAIYWLVLDKAQTELA